MQTRKQKLAHRLIYYESKFRAFLHRQRLPLWPDDRRIAKYRDAHSGKRAFILGNGPSLSVEDLDKLKSEITFASNKIFLCFDSTEWRPTYYVLSDLLVAAQNRQRIEELRMPKFLTNYAKPFLNGGPGTIWFNELSDNYPLNFITNYDAADPRQVRFSIDAAMGLHGGGTVIFNQLQLAYFMGITEVILLGVDFSFNVSGTKATKSFYNESLVSSGERNHFHPEYRKPGEVWSVPNLELQRLTFTTCRAVFETAGRKILNASRTTKLDVFEKVNLDGLLR